MKSMIDSPPEQYLTRLIHLVNQDTDELRHLDEKTKEFEFLPLTNTAIVNEYLKKLAKKLPATKGKSTQLSKFNFVIVIDTSGSMGEPIQAGSSTTRWESLQESVIPFIRDAEEFNRNGIGLVLFGGRNIMSFDHVTSDKALEIFSTTNPRGSTPLAEALTAALALAANSRKNDFIIVFTDGVPDEKEDSINVLVQAANAQETNDSLTILFVQIGDDNAATAYLKTLDDELANTKFDIVDTKTVYEAEAFSSTTELILATISS